MICNGCGKDGELRMGWCFACASAGDTRLGSRTVLQHVRHSLQSAFRGQWWHAKVDLKCAWKRATKTGNYGLNGEWRHLI